MPMRQSGLPNAEAVPSGTHILHYYHHGRDLIEMQAGFCRAGLLGGEYALWIVTPPFTTAIAQEQLKKDVPNVEEYVARGQLEFVSYSAWYFHEGNFSSEDTVRRSELKLTEAKRRGFRGARICGALSWLTTPEQWRIFLAFEQAIHQAVTGSEIIGLCSYPIRTSQDETETILVAAHHAVLRPAAQSWSYKPCHAQ
jgi:MEDS: MEthanogen/methylotroph, DcmR Sensory domain